MLQSRPLLCPGLRLPRCGARDRLHLTVEHVTVAIPRTRARGRRADSSARRTKSSPPNGRSPSSTYGRDSTTRQSREAEQAIALNPNCASGHNILGMSSALFRSVRTVAHDFERAIARTLISQTCRYISRGKRLTNSDDTKPPSPSSKRRIIRNPETDASRVLLAASYGQIGVINEAREEWQEALRVNPDYSLEYRRKVLPHESG